MTRGRCEEMAAEPTAATGRVVLVKKIIMKDGAVLKLRPGSEHSGSGPKWPCSVVGGRRGAVRETHAQARLIAAVLVRSRWIHDVLHNSPPAWDDPPRGGQRRRWMRIRSAAPPASILTRRTEPVTAAERENV
ncbi:hypothetical protein ILYODFUR_030512 [Ilyodon furcidens]|uniref:Uncharacterized protein n=1 Tax=Ilyodon furcidens TaxID=33524 RepID=A0ABV0TND5_9TELE